MSEQVRNRGVEEADGLTKSTVGAKNMWIKLFMGREDSE